MANKNVFVTESELDEVVNEMSKLKTSNHSAYSNIAEMASDEKLMIGMTAEVLGYTFVGDGGASKYSIDELDEGYGIPVANGYANIIQEQFMSPMMFGATGDGKVNDTVPVQKCLDFCANKCVMTIAEKCYLVKNLKLYNGNSYEIIGANVNTSVDIRNYSVGSLVAIAGSDAIFVGDTSKGVGELANLPTVTILIRDVKLSGYQLNYVFPMAFKDIHAAFSRFQNVKASWISCFFQGIMSSFTSVSECNISVTDCAFRSYYKQNEMQYYNGFIDTRFYSNYIMGILKFGTQLYYPKLFETTQFFCIEFSHNFCGNLWAIIGGKITWTLDDGTTEIQINSWHSDHNIFSYCVNFLMPIEEANRIFLHACVLDHDEVWYCSKHFFTESADGIRNFADANGNNRLTNTDIHFFGGLDLNATYLDGLVSRYCDKFFSESMKIKTSTITNGKVYYVQVENLDDFLYEFKQFDHIFDTKIPLDDYTEYIDHYKYTKIEPWDNRVVDSLPIIQDENYRYVIEGQTCIYNNKVFTCRGNRWYDAMGNPMG